MGIIKLRGGDTEKYFVAVIPKTFEALRGQNPKNLKIWDGDGDSIFREFGFPTAVYLLICTILFVNALSDTYVFYPLFGYDPIYTMFVQYINDTYSKTYQILFGNMLSLSVQSGAHETNVLGFTYITGYS